jgi:hypothetical protein
MRPGKPDNNLGPCILFFPKTSAEQENADLATFPAPSVRRKNAMYVEIIID